MRSADVSNCARAQDSAASPPAPPALESSAADGAPQSTEDLTIFVSCGAARRPTCREPASAPASPLSALWESIRRALVPYDELSFSLVPAAAQVQNLLQQMQGRFSTMSDAIIGRSERERARAALLPHPPVQPPSRPRSPSARAPGKKSDSSSRLPPHTHHDVWHARPRARNARRQSTRWATASMSSRTRSGS